MKKLLTLALAAITTMSLLTACGGQEGAAEDAQVALNSLYAGWAEEYHWTEDAASILQDRVDAQAEGGAWYPESMETWSNAQVIQEGAYVAMVACAQNQAEIVEQFQQQFQ